ncbi:reverse transcriptase family protein [Brevibacillus laterosporus]|uniref:reverse transcriptase family protein n=1 Tax=Brevibacillus laterosporus TaxID=1465 RepID=UPI000839D0DD|nr:reverse transcriptase family protein [Brevibacillus laterosporus]
MFVGDIILIYKKNFYYQTVLGVDDSSMVKEVIENKEKHYKPIVIYNRGKKREINCIEEKRELYNFQSNLAKNFLNKLPLPDNVCGFVKNRSYRDFLVPHINSHNSDRFYLRLDIKDFFNSISESHLREVLQEYVTIIDKEDNEEVILSMVNLVTLNGSLPQGGVTSPVLSNLVFRSIDIRIRNYCRKLDVTYTRYADDMLFSCDKEKVINGFFIKMIISILKSKKFVLNRRKVKKGASQISLNGFVVSHNIRISRKKRQDINRFIFLWEKGGTPKTIDELILRLNSFDFSYRIKDFNSKYSVLNYLAGYRSMLINWLPNEFDDEWYQQSERLIRKINMIIMKIEQLE